MMARLAGRARRALLRSAALLLAPAASLAQIPGESVNMVSGTGWPGGDPFLQRQNEPSLAVSSANPLHLLAGANDYRTVDLPTVLVDRAVGDAWLGVFKSFDGGQTWQSVLLPGYRQDTSAEGLASPLHGFEAAADPVVRAGTDGLFYFSGIVFDRGSNVGKVFVTRFFDWNDKENGDATAGRDRLTHLGPPRVVDTGTSGQFVDKPWLAVDVPRPGLAAGTCALPDGRTVPGGNVYFVYATFTGSGANASKIMFTRSTTCGDTWATPQKLSESNSLNQGTVAAVDPLTGDVHVAWRRFATSSQSDAILYARSTDGGLTFSKARVVAEARPFDQDLGTTRFRHHAFPAMAVSVDPTGSFVHLAWSRRNADGDGRIVLVTSADRGSTWSAPAPVDDAPLADDAGNAFTRGHQLMPALTFSQGRLVLVYYDSRLDHTRGYFQPNQPFLPDAQGRFYSEIRAPRGELVRSPGALLGPFIDDAEELARASLHLDPQVRHTLEVRVASAGPGSAPAFTAARVPSFRSGTRGDETPGLTAPAFGGGALQVVDGQGNVRLLQELQANPPNLPMFRQGTAPFMGDYIDVAGSAFVRTASGWAHDTAPSPAPVHHVIWTSNQDVVPPPDGDWTHYTPVGGGGPSVFDPSQATRTCEVGYAGSRNQNIYTSRITEGLQVSSPQNVKPLSATLTRAFVVAVLNATDQARAVRITAAPPAGVDASFRNDGVVLQSLDVVVPRRSTVHRALFVRLNGSSDPVATIPVTVQEVSSDPGCLGAIPPLCPFVQGGLSGFVTLNPPGARAALTQPDGIATDVSTVEIFPPTVGSATLTNPAVTSPLLAPGAAATLTNATLTNATLTNATLTNANLANAEVATLTNATLTNATLTNATLTNATLTNATLTNATLTNTSVVSGAISDATYVVTNEGNTTHSYHVKLVGSAPPSTPLQLIISRAYGTPVEQDCALVLEPHDVVLASIDDVSGAIVSPGGALADPNIPDPRATNATVALAPGESARITLRGAIDLAGMAQLASQLAPVVVPHAGGTFAAPLLVTTGGAALPGASVGVPYQGALQAMGGAAPYAWSLAPGSGPLPGGLALSTAGVISGTPTATGAFTFTVQVTDATGGSAHRALQLAVGTGPTTTTLSVSPAAPLSGQPVTLTATVAAATSGAGVPLPGGQVTFHDGEASLGAAILSGGSASLTVTTLSAGPHVLLAVYGGSATFAPSTSAPRVVTVAPVNYQFTGFLSPLAAAGTLQSPSLSSPQRLGGAVPIKWQLRDAAGAILSSLSTTRLLQAIQISHPACAAQPPPGATPLPLYTPTSGAAGGSTFRFDAKNQQFVFNWDTSSAVTAGCWEIVLQLADGSAARATVVPIR